MLGLFLFIKKADAPIVALAVLVSLANGLIPVCSTILIGRVFTMLARYSASTVTSAEFMDSVLRYCSGLLVLGPLTMVFSWLSFSTWSYIGYLQGHRARKRLYWAFMTKDNSWFDSADSVSGKALNFYKDIQDLESAAGIEIYETMLYSASTLSSLVVAFVYSWAVTLVCLAGIPFVVLITVFIAPRVARYIDKTKTIQDDASDRVNFISISLSTVKIFQRETWELVTLSKLWSQYRDASLAYWRLAMLQCAASRFFLLLMFLQCLYFGSFMIRKHGLNVGVVVTVLWSCLTAAGSIQGLLDLIVKLQKGVVSAQRLNKFFSSSETGAGLSIGMIPQSKVPSVTFSGVSFEYPSRPGLVFNNVHMDFDGGKTIYVLGPSGCGKSTVGALVTGQYTCKSGKILIGGIPIDFICKTWLFQNVYMVGQSGLFDIPIVENIRIGSRNPSLVPDSMINAAIHAMCAEFVYDLPHGIQTLGSFPLSGGQKQRILLCRAWMSDAAIMVLDECTNAMDLPLQRKLLERIQRIRAGKTTVVITHEHALIPHDARVIRIQDGTTTELEHEEVKSLAHNLKGQTEQEPLKAMLADTRDKDDCGIEVTTLCSPMLEDIEAQSEKVKPVIHRTGFRKTRRIFKTVRQKWFFVVGYAFVVAQAAMSPVFAFVLSRLLDELLPNNTNFPTLWGLLVLLCALVDGLLSYTQILLHIFSENWQLDMRRTLASELLEFNDLPPHLSSDYRKILSLDIEKCSQLFTLYWSGHVKMVTVGSMGLIWSLSRGWKLSLIGISLTPIFILATLLYKYTVSVLHSKREACRAGLVASFQEIVNSFRMVKAYHLEEYFCKLYLRQEGALWKASVRTALKTGIGYGFIQIFTPLMQGIILWYGMKLISIGEYTEERALAVFSLLIFTLTIVEGISRAISEVGNGFEVTERLVCLLDNRKPTPYTLSQNDTPGAPRKLGEMKRIEFEQLAIRVRRKDIFEPVSAIISPNQLCALTGPSGSGKTSICKLLERFDITHEGCILLEGINVKSISMLQLRQKLVLVEQANCHFFDGTILENLSYGCVPNDIPMLSPFNLRLAREVCAQCGLADFIEALDDGYDTKIKSCVLSNGQLQRLAIARGLMRRPDILVLDEPTASLDPESKTCIKKLLLHLRTTAQCTTIVVTHQQDVAELADSVIELATLV